ncbi:putative ribose-5-phosphate isomerase 4 [Nymphaea thermarum]|nr:putative ribose-5-phosphate isomerase 4 [Nymphaea thermarum]
MSTPTAVGASGKHRTCGLNLFIISRQFPKRSARHSNRLQWAAWEEQLGPKKCQNMVVFKNGPNRVNTYVKSGMVVGLGTGRASTLIIKELGQQLKVGNLKDIVGVPMKVGAALTGSPAPSVAASAAAERPRRQKAGRRGLNRLPAPLGSHLDSSGGSILGGVLGSSSGSVLGSIFGGNRQAGRRGLNRLPAPPDPKQSSWEGVSGIDLILGMPWFYTLGIISWDVKRSTMTFTPDGTTEPMTLQGVSSSIHPKAAMRAVNTEQPVCWVMALATNVPSKEEHQEIVPESIQNTPSQSCPGRKLPGMSPYLWRDHNSSKSLKLRILQLKVVETCPVHLQQKQE